MLEERENIIKRSHEYDRIKSPSGSCEVPSCSYFDTGLDLEHEIALLLIFIFFHRFTPDSDFIVIKKLCPKAADIENDLWKEAYHSEEEMKRYSWWSIRKMRRGNIL